MTTSIDLCSNALILLGEDAINALSDNEAAANLYDSSYEGLLCSHPWGFAFKELVLSRLTQTPSQESGYSYAFQLPADLLRVWAALPVADYVIVGNLLYSNNSSITLRYIYRVDETDLPSYVIPAIQFQLAAEFALSVTEDVNKADLYTRKANMALGQAKSIDSQSRPQQAVVRRPFYQGRTW